MLSKGMKEESRSSKVVLSCCAVTSLIISGLFAYFYMELRHRQMAYDKYMLEQVAEGETAMTYNNCGSASFFPQDEGNFDSDWTLLYNLNGFLYCILAG